MTSPLLDSVVLSDARMSDTKAKMAGKAGRHLFAWLSMDVVLQTVASTLVSATVYLAHSYYSFPLSDGVTSTPHMLTGAVLGVLLVSRVVVGVMRKNEGVAQVANYAGICRSLAVLSCSVSETLTISAAAETENKAVKRFRYELVRLLNLSFYCYTLMLQGMKLAVPPTSLRSADGKQEAEVLANVENPAVMASKLISSLIEQQRAAKRISSEQAAAFQGKVCELVSAYHDTLALALAPPPIALTSFAFFFTAAWAYSAGAVLAVTELSSNEYSTGFGLLLTVAYSCFISLFVFGLYEAGNVAEAPLKAVADLSALEDMTTGLSDDLASLVDDDAVPVFIPKAKEMI